MSILRGSLRESSYRDTPDGDVYAPIPFLHSLPVVIQFAKRRHRRT